jgi:putative transposase
MCEALGVSRGGFYGWLTRPRSQRDRRDEELGAMVRASFLASDRTYGARRVWRDLLAEGRSCGLHRIERLMRLQALKARPNVLDRSFEASAPNRNGSLASLTPGQRKAGSMWLPSATCSRGVLSAWSMNAAMTAQLVTDALVMAIWRRGKPDALLHHSDRGSPVHQ